MLKISLAGIPVPGDNKFTEGKSETKDCWMMGHQSSFMKIFTAPFTASVGAGDTVCAVTSIKASELEVPFTTVSAQKAIASRLKRRASGTVFRPRIFTISFYK